MLKSISGTPGAGGPATSINPGVPIGNITPGSGAFTTLSSTSTTDLSTTAGQFTTIGTGAASTKLNVHGTHVAGIGIMQIVGISTAAYLSLNCNPAGESGFLLRSAGTLVGHIYSDPTGVRVKNRIVGAADQFTINNSGRVGIGAIGSNATAQFHLPASVSTAFGSGLKLTSGPLLTVTEPGAEEFLTNDRYYTGTDNTRRRYAVNSQVITLMGVTVAGLPAGTQGNKAFVTDALAPTYLAGVVGGGAVVTEVFYNGTAWVCT